MEIIAHLFYGAGNWIIIAFGTAVMIVLLRNGLKLSDRKNRIDEELSQNERKTTIDSENHTLSEEISEKRVSDYNLDKIRKFKKEFNNLCSKHSAVSQLIPVFPLLGVFGTVWGLMKQVQAGDVEAMLSSLDTALTTTIWGLLFAIVLKVTDALFPSRIISDAEVLFDDFETKIENTSLFRD